MQIADNCAVAINYTLKNDDGETIDQSPGGEPLVYIHGAAGIIPGLENELTGKAEGDTFEVTIKPEEAYGERRPELVGKIPRTQLPQDQEIQVGMQLHGQNNGAPVMVTVIEVEEETVTIDGNHPLAGMTLHFSGSIDGVREASEEELKQTQVQ